MIKVASKNTDNTSIPPPPAETKKSLSKPKWERKQMYEYFKLPSLTIEDLDISTKGKRPWEKNETLLITVQRTNYTKVKIDYTQQINKYRLCGTIYQPLRSGRIWHKVNF